MGRMTESGLDLDPVLGVAHKSVPPALWGRRASEVAAERPPVSAFATPLLVLDRAASDANVAQLVGWARERGLDLAPHGKTTMAPALWRRLLDAGCWRIAVATPWQAQVARAAGVTHILLANEVVDPVGAAWIARELDAHPQVELACWVDSAAAVEALAATAGRRPIDVLVEVGGEGGRTGVRSTEDALALADRVAREPRLRLRGVSGYEGSYGADRRPATVAAVQRYLAGLAEVTSRVLEAHVVEDPIVSAAGSTWFDLVAEELAPLVDRARIVLRAGAFQAHDDVFYAGNAPLELRPALTVFSRVVSRPEPGLALLDAGKRDVPSDLDLPLVLQTSDGRALPGARVVALNDQHARLELPPELELAVGEVVLLGISHPCTAFDRWRLLPEVEHARDREPRVVGFVVTVF
jgi:D-serine deaminase-like pyridoxal phosphate-dependent protein